MSPHPFDQLSVPEMEKVVVVVKKNHAGKTLHLKSIGAEEPPKSLMAPYLAAKRAGKTPTPPPRVAHCIYYVLQDKLVNQCWVDVSSGTVIKNEVIKKGIHPPIDPWEANEAFEAAFAHPLVQDAIKKCGLEHLIDNLTIDGWMYGCDSELEMPRFMQMLVYCRDPKNNHQDSNMYSFPVPFVPVYDVLDKKLIRVDFCATGGDDDDAAVKGVANYDTRPEGKNCIEHCVTNDYLPELQDKMRTDLKPYNVIQPDGPSYHIDKDGYVNWQKWHFKVGFTPREGLVIHDVHYDGRSTFYRLSMSEMAVPYADPRPPLHRKMAFDFGDCGGGKCANELTLGCDCLGTIKYFDGNVCDPEGNVFTRKNVICMHEQDDGIGWKHTNYRTDVVAITRRRILVLQTILTVGNYEYIFAWHFDQSAGIQLEIRATGIVSTQLIDAGKKSKFGTIVSPGVLAASHQHIFNMRMDPAIDGHKNTVYVNDTVSLPWDEKNPHGIAFENTKTPIEKSCYLDSDIQKNRYLKICNENKLNPVSGNPVGYKVGGLATAMLYAQPGSIARSRAAFATHHYWVTKYKDQEFFAGGVWTNQSAQEIGGVQDAVARNENVRNDDVVLWHSFGLTHHPRVEDFPVMPCEIMKVHLSPNDFFTGNPSVDVPKSNQTFNRSVEVKDCRSCKM
ncbi:Copper amine oxidase 1 [Yarrowia sp. C11]|nr:Copper amine oxidase 1 [Yarrowia sp. E02]KAG5365316.1 Copper amine oxidase 1 [Yarrowia sp. C11]